MVQAASGSEVIVGAGTVTNTKRVREPAEAGLDLALRPA
jgi:2-keto-3-deoxy-6-phosphogluconate aldolase